MSPHALDRWLARRSLPLLSLAAAVALASCDADPVQPPRPAPAAAASASAAVAAGMAGGNGHFFLLPPIAPQPSYAGAFDPTRSPVVKVCALGADARCVAAASGADADAGVARYTMSTGPGSETVRLDLKSEQYVVNWHTDQFPLDAGATYRVSVWVDGAPLGHADVKVFASQQAARSTATGAEFALVNGRTLPIKFRLEVGVPHVVAPSATVTQTIATPTSPAGTSATLTVPPAALTTAVPITVEPVAVPSTDLASAGIVPGTVFDFGPDGATFAKPLVVGVTYDAAKVPAGKEGELRLYWRKDGGRRWYRTRNTSVNTTTKTVTGETTHFTEFGVQPQFPEIAFVSGAAGTSTGDLYVMSPDGTGARQLTTGIQVEYPRWSRDSSNIVFTGFRNGSGDIYTARADGTALTQLTHDASGEMHPAWSPDGSKIAFSRNHSGRWDVFVMNADGTGVRQLTSNHEVLGTGDSTQIAPGDTTAVAPGDTTVYTQPFGDGMVPVWSPDGTRIVFETTRHGEQELYVMNADGSAPRRLTVRPDSGGAWYATYALWSPTGTHIAFTNSTGGEIGGVYVVDANATAVQPTRIRPGDAYAWAWSPDGTRLAGGESSNGSYNNFTIQADGNGLTYLSPDSKDDWEPAWSADGAEIVFWSNRGGTWDVYVTNADGSGTARRLTSNGMDNRMAATRP